VPVPWPTRGRNEKQPRPLGAGGLDGPIGPIGPLCPLCPFNEYWRRHRKRRGFRHPRCGFVAGGAVYLGFRSYLAPPQAVVRRASGAEYGRRQCPGLQALWARWAVDRAPKGNLGESAGAQASPERAHEVSSLDIARHGWVACGGGVCPTTNKPRGLVRGTPHNVALSKGGNTGG
jgi:hypothetical protein